MAMSIVAILLLLCSAHGYMQISTSPHQMLKSKSSLFGFRDSLRNSFRRKAPPSQPTKYKFDNNLPATPVAAPATDAAQFFADKEMMEEEAWTCDSNGCYVVIDTEDGKAKPATMEYPSTRVRSSSSSSTSFSTLSEDEIISNLLREAKENGGWDEDLFSADECKLVWKDDDTYDLVCDPAPERLQEWDNLLSEEDRKIARKTSPFYQS